jgi:hypothetical protein
MLCGHGYPEKWKLTATRMSKICYFDAVPDLSQGTEGNQYVLQSEQLVSAPRFEHGTSIIKIKNESHCTFRYRYLIN